jgi:8-oxo-dGTP diphosphatase
MSLDRKLEAALLEARQLGVERFIAAAIFVCTDRALVLRRLTTETDLPGLWELPGGGVEPGESVLEGLRREIDEETGIVFEAMPHLSSWFDYRNSKGTRSRQFNFLIELPHEISPARHPEHDAYQWIDAAQVQTLNCSPETRRSILEILTTK